CAAMISPPSLRSSRGKEAHFSLDSAFSGVIRASLPRLLRAVYALAALAATMPGFAPSARAQRAFSISLAPTNQSGIVIRWKAQSATPAGDLTLVPQFVVQRTIDFTNWTPISGNLTAALNQTLSLVDSNANTGFYRVQSLIEEEYAEMNGA